jgi:hypothetical protein
VRETEGVAYDTYIGERYDDGLGNCAICLDSTQLAETAVLKGCEHQVCPSAPPAIVAAFRMHVSHLTTMRHSCRIMHRTRRM